MPKEPSNIDISFNQKVIRASVIIVLILLMDLVVYLSGGTEAAFTHLMYIPIMISAFFFGMAGAVSAALLGGLLLGPFMPVNVSRGIMQEPCSWIFRVIIFILIGIVVALLLRSVRRLSTNEIERALQFQATGRPNANKLKRDLAQLISQKKSFSLIGFRIVIELLEKYSSRTVYSIFNHEFAVILSGYTAEQALSVGSEFLSRLKEPLLIGRFKIGLAVKGGIVSYPMQGNMPNDLIRKMGIALGQDADELGLIAYDASFEQKNRERYELMVSLLDAVKNEEFFLVYQPKKSLNGSRELSVEALIRWSHRTKGPINPGEFIKIAEEIGIINEITKWVIRTVIAQVKHWQDSGMQVTAALNISAKDLRDRSLVNYLVTTLDEYALEPGRIELELTERSILQNAANARQLLNELRAHGIKIALDDFGTGYNSLLGLVSIPVDYLKIDRAFIDHIQDRVNQVMIESIMDFAHKTGKQVIAEGVEEQEQLELLQRMGCDYIQGYYFSKPLPPEEVKNYMLEAGFP